MAHFEKEDLPDAEVWIAKAAMLGLEFIRYQSEPDEIAWACSYTYNGIRHYGDHPGHAAKAAVLHIMERTHDGS